MATRRPRGGDTAPHPVASETQPLPAVRIKEKRVEPNTPQPDAGNAMALNLGDLAAAAKREGVDIAQPVSRDLPPRSNPEKFVREFSRDLLDTLQRVSDLASQYVQENKFIGASTRRRQEEELIAMISRIATEWVRDPNRRQEIKDAFEPSGIVDADDKRGMYVTQLPASFPEPALKGIVIDEVIAHPKFQQLLDTHRAQIIESISNKE